MLYVSNPRPRSFPRAPVVLISVDTLRADAVAGFGAPADATPNLNVVGQEGIRFRTAIAASHLTAPSHASLLTGYSTHVHGVAMGQQGRAWSIPATIPTLAEILKNAGYRTAAFTDGVQLLPEGGFARGFEIYDHETTGLESKLGKIETFLTRHEGEPVFLFLHTYRAHQPYRAPLDLLSDLIEDYEGVYLDAAREVAWLSHKGTLTSSPQQARLGRALSGSRAESEEDRRFFRRLYDAGVTGADREVGSVLQLLRDLDVYDQAVLVITSDHGEAFFEHGYDSHSTIHDECIRVPLIVRLPGGIGAGRQVDWTFPAIDVVPTIVDLVKANSSLTCEGRSKAPYLYSGEPEESPAFASWFYGKPVPLAPGVCARTRSGKLIRLDDYEDSFAAQFVESGLVFFDLEADPLELRGRAAASSPIEIELRQSLQEAEDVWEALRGAFGVVGAPGTVLGAEAEEALRAIGYMKGDR